MTVHINNQPVETRPGDTLLDAIRRAGANVPTLCHIDGLPPTGACRMCVVEVEGQRGLIPSCSYPAADGMRVLTHSPRALRARKTIVELLLANHPDDCLYCARNRTCRLQDLADELGVRQRRYGGPTREFKLDISSPSVMRDPNKCILCGKCVRVCEEVQSVGAIDFIGRGSRATVGTAFDEGLNVSSCINCGQCILVCPTGALREPNQFKEVVDAINDPDRFVVVQHAPSISVTLGEAFGFRPGVDVAGVMTAALRRLGFDRVFDTSFAADLTVMEEASELAHRLTTGGTLPMFTSCSPGWVKFVEQFYPEFIPNLSTCKSPQQMLGALTKAFFAEREGIDPRRIFNVSIMPCTAKKFEATRPELLSHGMPDIDAVLTTREIAHLIRERHVDLDSLSPEGADTPFGERSTAGKLFGATGGVAEAALRTAYHLVTGGELADLRVKAVRGLDGVKEAVVAMGDLEVRVGVVSGLGNARRVLDQIRSGERKLHFLEVMACPGGCIAGGGQLLGADPERIRRRMRALYSIDRDGAIRTAHQNPAIQRVYREYLGEPFGERSHHLLHTHYARREALV